MNSIPGTEKPSNLEVKNMPKYCMNYESGDYEYIDENGYSWDRNEYVYNWDDSEYRREREDRCNYSYGGSLWNDDEDEW